MTGLRNKLLAIIAFSLVVGMAPVFAFAKDKSAVSDTAKPPLLLSEWKYPSGAQLYEKGDPVLFHGTYQLPVGWVMNIYMTIDGTEDSSYVAVSNRGGTATRTGSFSTLVRRDLARGEHNANLTLYAANACVFDPHTPCVRNEKNYRPNIAYPLRGFNVLPYFEPKK